MLIVKLPEALEKQLNRYCKIMRVSKSSVVREALQEHLKKGISGDSVKKTPEQSPFLDLVGTGNGRYTTAEVMCLMRGDKWDQPR